MVFMNTTNASVSPILPSSSPAPASGNRISVFSTENTEGIAANLNYVATLAASMEKRLSGAVKQIEAVNLQTRLLSFNAQLEATRAGEVGRAFEVVAREIVGLSAETGKVATTLDEQTRRDIRELGTMIDTVGCKVRGTRLSDLAFTNIDLIDRNLYERSCDVRWWASDSSCVEAATDPAKANYAGQRLGIILDSYTVYYDIVLCDLDGRVIANGRPSHYASTGTRQGDTEWFRSAMATRSGTEFGFQGVHRSPSLAGNQPVLVYSAMVRRDGRPDGDPIGCLGIVFNWEALAQTIVKRRQFSDAEARHTRVCIVDGEGKLIADSEGRHLKENFPLKDFAELAACRQGYVLRDMAGKPSIVAHALSPGFETYATGWHSFILQRQVID